MTILLFASLGEKAGTSRLTLEARGESVAEVYDRLVERFPALAEARERALVAVNQQYAGWDDTVSEGDEVAFFPPVSGG